MVVGCVARPLSPHHLIPFRPRTTAAQPLNQLSLINAGKFNKARAVELGVKVGPDFGKLAGGQPVTTADGKTVRPEDVLGETVVGACLFVAACPNAVR